MRSLPLSSLAITIAVLGSGCPGRLADPERFGAGISRVDAATPRGDGSVTRGDGSVTRGDGSVTRGDGGDGIDVPAMLAAECAASGCHGSSTPAFGLDLESAGVADRLRDATSTTCMDLPLVDPADPDASFLLDKVVSASPTCGGRMPLGREPLTQAQQDALRAWIAEL